MNERIIQCLDKNDLAERSTRAATIGDLEPGGLVIDREVSRRIGLLVAKDARTVIARGQRSRHEQLAVSTAIGEGAKVDLNGTIPVDEYGGCGNIGIA